MPTSKVNSNRSAVPAVMASKSAKASAKKPTAAKTKAPTSPSTVKGSPREKPDSAQSPPASELIDKRIAEIGGWRGAALNRIRRLIKEADPGVIEEWKWSVPVWSHGGIICTGESYKSVVKLTFLKGASLKDPAKLFNSSLDGNTRRAIDIREGEETDADKFKALIRAAIALNASDGKAKAKQAK